MSFPSLPRFLLLCSLINLLSADPCLFSKDCSCMKSASPDPLKYETVACSTCTWDLPTFTVSPSEKYTTNGLTIIAHLQLFHYNSSLVPQQWDDGAFNGVDIEAIVINNLGGLVPPPKSLVSLGRRGLKSIFIQESSPVQLTEHVFKDFPSMSQLAIYDTEITRLDVKAFDGIEKMEFIFLRNVGLTTIDLSVFAEMRSGITTNAHVIDSPSLKSVTVSDTSKFPDQIAVSLSNNSLETIDPKLGDLLDQKQLLVIFIENNVHLQCQTLDWMAPYVLDYKRVKRVMTKGAKCADWGGKTLDEYLKSTRETSQTSSTSTSTSTSRATSSTTSSSAAQTTASTSRPPPAQTTTTTSTTSTSTSTKPTTKAAFQVSIWISLIAALSTFLIYLKR